MGVLLSFFLFLSLGSSNSDSEYGISKVEIYFTSRQTNIIEPEEALVVLALVNSVHRAGMSLVFVKVTYCSEDELLFIEDYSVC